VTGPKPRLCATTDEAARNEDGEYYIRFITEGQPGWVASKATFPDLLDARAHASIFNHLTQRLTVDDVRQILDNHYGAKA
jgi:hypothetical protein